MNDNELKLKNNLKEARTEKNYLKHNWRKWWAYQGTRSARLKQGSSIRPQSWL